MCIKDTLLNTVSNNDNSQEYGNILKKFLSCSYGIGPGMHFIYRILCKTIN